MTYKIRHVFFMWNEAKYKGMNIIDTTVVEPLFSNLLLYKY